MTSSFNSNWASILGKGGITFLTLSMSPVSSVFHTVVTVSMYVLTLGDYYCDMLSTKPYPTTKRRPNKARKDPVQAHSVTCIKVLEKQTV